MTSKEAALQALEAKVHRLHSTLPDLRQKLHDRVQSGEAFSAERTTRLILDVEAMPHRASTRHRVEGQSALCWAKLVHAINAE